jgi:hypothetical protein
VQAEVSIPSKIMNDLGRIWNKRKKEQDYVKNSQHHELPCLDVGDEVLMQHPKDKKWESAGVIEAVHDDGRSYDIILNDSGKSFRRNRRYLRPNSAKTYADGAERKDVKGDALVPSLRRSTRISEQKVRTLGKSISFAQRILVSYF